MRQQGGCWKKYPNVGASSIEKNLEALGGSTEGDWAIPLGWRWDKRKQGVGRLQEKEKFPRKSMS